MFYMCIGDVIWACGYFGLCVIYGCCDTIFCYFYFCCGEVFDFSFDFSVISVGFAVDGVSELFVEVVGFLFVIGLLLKFIALLGSVCVLFLFWRLFIVCQYVFVSF